MAGRSGFGIGAVAIGWLLWGGCSGGTLRGGAADGGGGRAGPSVDAAVDVRPLHPIGEACPAPTRSNSCGPETPPCWKTCGPARSGFKNCSCDWTGVMVCDATCNYEPGADLSCFALPNPVPACPPDPANEIDQLPRATDPCALDPCRPCGSTTMVGYYDTSGAPKAGFCVCAPSPTTGQNVYSCAGVADWPPQRPPTLE